MMHLIGGQHRLNWHQFFYDVLVYNMELNPFYFFMALFISFFFIYIFKNDHYVIMKNKKKSDGSI
jgi:hypothetical protein